MQSVSEYLYSLSASCSWEETGRGNSREEESGCSRWPEYELKGRFMEDRVIKQGIVENHSWRQYNDNGGKAKKADHMIGCSTRSTWQWEDRKIGRGCKSFNGGLGDNDGIRASH